MKCLPAQQDKWQYDMKIPIVHYNMRPIVGIGKRYCNHRYMETIFRFIKHCDDCEKWPKDHWKKKKYYFQAATTMSKLMKAPKLSAWSMINAVGSPLTSLLLLLPLDISRGSHPCKHTALPRRRRAGHGSMSARARGAPPCKKYNLERGNRPSIQLPTPSPIISIWQGPRDQKLQQLQQIADKGGPENRGSAKSH